MQGAAEIGVRFVDGNIRMRGFLVGEGGSF